MIRLRLCGGLADGQILELRRGLPPDLRVPIWDVTERPLPDADPLPQTPLREETYYLTGIVNSAGEFIYAAGGLSERFRAAILAHEESLHRISGVIEEWAYGLLIERSFGDHSESFF